MTVSDTQTGTTTFKRVMLKISGEALMGDQGFGLHPPTVRRIADATATGLIARAAWLGVAVLGLVALVGDVADIRAVV